MADHRLQLKQQMLFALAAAGDRDAQNQAFEHFMNGLPKYIASGGQMDLAFCCGLPPPSAKKALSRMQRNLWLLRAHRVVSDGETTARSVALEAAWRTFVGRLWPLWRKLDAPPANASQLHAALFHATRAWTGKVLSAKQIGRIYRSAQDVGIVTSRDILAREALRAWAADPALQAEFSAARIYVAFFIAQAEGRISISKAMDKTTDWNVRSDHS